MKKILPTQVLDACDAFLAKIDARSGILDQPCGTIPDEDYRYAHHVMGSYAALVLRSLAYTRFSLSWTDTEAWRRSPDFHRLLIQTEKFFSKAMLEEHPGSCERLVDRMEGFSLELDDALASHERAGTFPFMMHFEDYCCRQAPTSFVDQALYLTARHARTMVCEDYKELIADVLKDLKSDNENIVIGTLDRLPVIQEETDRHDCSLYYLDKNHKFVNKPLEFRKAAQNLAQHQNARIAEKAALTLEDLIQTDRMTSNALRFVAPTKKHEREALEYMEKSRRPLAVLRLV